MLEGVLLLWTWASQQLFARLCAAVVREVGSYLQELCLPQLDCGKLRLYNPRLRSWRSVLLSGLLDIESESSYILISPSELLAAGLGAKGNCAIVTFRGEVIPICSLPVAVSGPGLCCRAEIKEIFSLGGLQVRKPVRMASVLKLRSQSWQTLSSLCEPRGYPCVVEQDSGLFVCDAVCPTPERYCYLTCTFRALPYLEPLPACSVTAIGETCLCLTELGDLISVEGTIKRFRMLANWQRGMRCYRVGACLYFLKYPLTKSASQSVALISIIMDRGRSASEAVVIPPSLSEETFKRDSTCVGCGLTFGKVLNIVHAKRYCCKFCNRGVCAKCSPYRLMHPSTLQQERCCNTCYSHLVTQDIRSETQGDLRRTETEVRLINAEVFKEIQAQEDCEAQLRDLLTLTVQLQSRLDAQTAATQQVLAQRNARLVTLNSSVSTLKSEIKAKQERQKELLQTLAAHEEKRAQLRKQQTLDQQKAADIQALKAEIDRDIETLRVQLRESVVTEEASEKNKRVAELQQAVALEREILVKLQHRNLELSQKRSRLLGEPQRKSREVELREGALSNLHEPELLKSKVAQLAAENHKLRSHLTQRTPDGDGEMEELREQVQRAKEENTRLMLQFQEQLLHPDARSDPLTRKHCSNCLLA